MSSTVSDPAQSIGRRVPEGFQWGAATAAYQVEGAVREGGRGPSNWDEYSHRPGTTYRGDTGDIAADHYHRFDEDLDLMRELGIGMYRFSVSWSRVMPDVLGKPNEVGLDFYRRLVEGLLRRGITPMVTINHLELPAELERQGGWCNRNTVDRFVDYASILHRALGDRVKHWVTLNEAQWVAWIGYGGLLMPPAANRPCDVLPVMHNQLLAHADAVNAMRASSNARGSQYGIVGSWWPAYAASDSASDREAAERVNDALNRITTEPLFKGRYPATLLEWHRERSGRPFECELDLPRLRNTCDFFGLNYYAPVYVAHAPAGGSGMFCPPGFAVRQVDPPDATRSAMGWIVDAAGLADVLKTFDRDYKVPLYITENGIALDDYVSPEGRIRDIERVQYLSTHIDAMENAIAQGVDVRGYLVWSLIDNFEWGYGYSKRFGLVYVDFATQKRTPKDSYHWYRNLVRSRPDSGSRQRG